MKKFRKYSVVTFVVALAAIMFSCVDDEYDKPPITEIPVGNVYTIQQVKDFFINNGNSTYTFTEDASVYATVTMDNETDNSYRTFFIQDNTGAIAVFQDVSGGVYIGDSVRVYLKDLVVMKYQELFQINTISGDGVNVDENLIKQGTNNKRTPEEASIADITVSAASKAYYQGRLVKISNVQFVDTDTTKKFANSETLETEERLIQDENDRQLIVRTSGYATFADANVPDGSGSLIAIVGQYGDNLQLYIRRLSEVEMDNERFDLIVPTPVYQETFGSGLGDFTTYSVTGPSQVWEHSSQFSCALMTGYDGSRYANNDWLISPAIDLTDRTGSFFNFTHAIGYGNYSGINDELKAYVSTDYSGSGDPSAANWTEVSFTWPADLSDFFEWTNSGDVSLSNYDGQSGIYVAFNYNCGTSNASTWEIKNFAVKGIANTTK